MHFNTKIAFNRLVSDLDKEGVRRFRTEPWDIDYTKVEGYAPGEVQLDNGTTAYVAEGYEEIKRIMDDKEAEKERYDEYQRQLGIMGMASLPGDDDDTNE